VLGLGFGLGAGKFVRIVKEWTGKDISDTDAKNTVAAYRRTNKPITDLWRSLEGGLRESLGGTFESELPSGRKIRYFNVGSGCGQVEHGAPVKNLYGGLLFENAVQATARDLFGEAILRCERHAPVVLHVHDEIVREVPEAEAEEAAREMEKLLTTVPEWAPGLPVAAEVKVLEKYEK
jgi:DNA polymerase